jgi:hypothetical protein
VSCISLQTVSMPETELIVCFWPKVQSEVRCDLQIKTVPVYTLMIRHPNGLIWQNMTLQ